jgi:hypothetical protein
VLRSAEPSSPSLLLHTAVESTVYSVSRTAGRDHEPRLGGSRVGEVPYQRTMTSIVSFCPAFCDAGASGALRLVVWIFLTCKTPVGTQSGCKWIANRELFELPNAPFSMCHASILPMSYKGQMRLVAMISTCDAQACCSR